MFICSERPSKYLIKKYLIKKRFDKTKTKSKTLASHVNIMESEENTPEKQVLKKA